jgi:hypothetical protein
MYSWDAVWLVPFLLSVSCTSPWYDRVELLLGWELAGETELLGENPIATLFTRNSRCHVLGMNVGSRCGEQLTNRQSGGKTSHLTEIVFS